MRRLLAAPIGGIVLLLVATVAAHAESLTEAAVERLVDSIAEAVARQDPQELAAYFSPQARFELTSYFDGEAQKMDLSLQQYIAIVEAVWVSYQDYDYEIVSLEMERTSAREMTVFCRHHRAHRHRRPGAQGVLQGDRHRRADRRRGARHPGRRPLQDRGADQHVSAAGRTVGRRSQRFMRFSTRSSTTLGSARVEVSPRAP